MYDSERYTEGRADWSEEPDWAVEVYDEPESPQLDARRISLILGGALVAVMAVIGVTFMFLAGGPNDGGAIVPPATPTASIEPSPTPTPAPESPVIIDTPASPTPSATPTIITPTASPSDEPKSLPSPSPSPSQAPGVPSVTPAPLPAGDAFERPIALATFPSTYALDTTHATTQPSDPDCDGRGPTVWFSYTPARSGRIVANTFGSSYDTTLYAGFINRWGVFSLVDCNDDVSSSVQSAIRLDVTAGVSYLFMVGAFGDGQGGQLTFNLAEAPEMASLVLTLDPVGSFDALGRATISGTATCSSRVDGLYIDVSLSQRVNRQIFRGWADLYLERCSSRTRSWSVLVVSDSGTFGAEPATARASAYLCDPYECQNVELEQAVSLISSVVQPSPSPMPSAEPSAEPSQAPAVEPPADPGEGGGE